MWAVVLGLGLVVGGCAPKASEALAKVHVGMTPAEVAKVLGPPQRRLVVSFPDASEEFVVWVYNLVPDHRT